MPRAKVFFLVLSLGGAFGFFRAYYLVSFASGYGIREADRNQLMFLCGTVVFLVAFLASAASLYFGGKRHH